MVHDTSVWATGVVPGGLVLLVYVLFSVDLCTGLILWFLNNLWFGDFRAE